MNKEEPKKIIHHRKVYSQHQWKLDEYGQPDDWAFEYDYHNGYVCIRCGYSFCKHCEPNGFEKAKTVPCIVEYDTCPNCNKRIFLWKYEKYCSYCGQRVEQ